MGGSVGDGKKRKEGDGKGKGNRDKLENEPRLTESRKVTAVGRVRLDTVRGRFSGRWKIGEGRKWEMKR